MSAELNRVRQCLACGAVTGDIQAKHRSVHVEAKAVLLQEEPRGETIGYTQGGKMFRGRVVDKAGPGGACEVFLEHKCRAEKAAAEG